MNKKLLSWESNFLFHFKNAVSKSNVNDPENVSYVTLELRMCVEKLQKAICCVKYNIPDSQNIKDAFDLLDRKKFWGVGTGSDFVYHSEKLRVINSEMKVINSIGNVVKHYAYIPTLLESIVCLYSMNGIIDWYFHNINEHANLDLSDEQRVLLKSVFENKLLISNEVKNLMRHKDQQIDDLIKSNEDLKAEIIKIHTKKKNYVGLFSNKISERENNTYSIEEEVNQLKKTIVNFDNESLYNRCGFLIFNLAILKDNDERKLEEARRMFLKAIDIDQYNYEAYNNLGNVLAKQAEVFLVENLYHEAIEKYIASIKINPNYFYAYYNCGAIYHKLFKVNNDNRDFLEKSIEYYLQGEKLADSDYKEYHSYNIACIFALQYDSDKAIEYLQRAILSNRNYIEQVFVDEDFNSINDNPKFTAFLASLNQ
jgi:tetratricopeptide (TPR) repeat protein